MGIEVRPDGYVKMSELMKLQPEKYKLEHIRQVVADCEKQRFKIETIEGELYIRANQGHSQGMGIDAEKLLTEITDPSQIPECIHGTYKKVLPLIMQSGLSRMARDHVHFTTSRVQNEDARSGFRSSCDVLIILDVAAAMADGLRFFRSANGVILTEGVDGLVSKKYFK